MKIQELLEEAKSSKKESAYQNMPKNNKKCTQCTMWRPPQGCTAVAGNISPDGWCKYFKSKTQ